MSFCFNKPNCSNSLKYNASIYSRNGRVKFAIHNCLVVLALFHIISFGLDLSTCKGINLKKKVESMTSLIKYFLLNKLSKFRL